MSLSTGCEIVTALSGVLILILTAWTLIEMRANRKKPKQKFWPWA